MRETRNQIDDLMNEIRTVVDRGERTLVTTLTKKMSEDLTDYLLEMGFKVRYLHSEIDTLERIQIIRDLRLGEYDVLVGVNLLREGLDLPEVSLVAILDADKEGFLRGETSLIQTIGRAARNIEGKVLMYADKETDAMRAALGETDRRRAIQLAYNEEHGITAATIVKGISDIAEFLQSESKLPGKGKRKRKRAATEAMTLSELEQTIVELEEEMLAAAEELRFEYAARVRDEIRDLRRELDDRAGQRGAGRVDADGRRQPYAGAAARRPLGAAAASAASSQQLAEWWPRVGAAAIDFCRAHRDRGRVRRARRAGLPRRPRTPARSGSAVGRRDRLPARPCSSTRRCMLARTGRPDRRPPRHQARAIVMADGSRMPGGRAFVREVLVKNILIEGVGAVHVLHPPDRQLPHAAVGRRQRGLARQDVQDARRRGLSRQPPAAAANERDEQRARGSSRSRSPRGSCAGATSSAGPRRAGRARRAARAWRRTATARRRSPRARRARSRRASASPSSASRIGSLSRPPSVSALERVRLAPGEHAGRQEHRPQQEPQPEPEQDLAVDEPAVERHAVPSRAPLTRRAG